KMLRLNAHKSDKPHRPDGVPACLDNTRHANVPTPRPWQSPADVRPGAAETSGAPTRLRSAPAAGDRPRGFLANALHDVGVAGQCAGAGHKMDAHGKAVPGPAHLPPRNVTRSQDIRSRGEPR